MILSREKMMRLCKKMISSSMQISERTELFVFQTRSLRHGLVNMEYGITAYHLRFLRQFRNKVKI